MKTHVFIAGFLLAGLCTQMAAAQAPDAASAEKACPAPQFHAALKATDTIDGWNALHQTYQQYGACDFGTVSGNFTYNITMLLITRWDSVQDLAKITYHDKGFGPFIAAHLTQQLSPEQNLKLTDLAHQHCPPGATPFCDKLLDSLYDNEVVRRSFRMAN